ncbi:MAG: hypothetical protein NT106_13920 [Candidatus Sumerlaeota bacterium]|nr:hypothetical protein [Candidatus Sumerlaeota bacterium]
MKKYLICSAIFCLIAFSAFAEIPPNWKFDAPQPIKTATITNYQLGGSVGANVVEITTGAPHGMFYGEQVFILTGNPVIDTNPYTPYSITAVPTATSFRFARTAGNIVSTPVVAPPNTAVVNWLGLNYENRGATYNDAMNHLLVARSTGVSGNAGVHIVNWDGLNVGEMKMGPTLSNKKVEVLSAAVTNKQLITNVATLTFAAHNFLLGEIVVVSLNPIDAAFAGQFTITAVTATTISYAKANIDVLPAVSGGNVYSTFRTTLDTVIPHKLNANQAVLVKCTPPDPKVDSTAVALISVVSGPSQIIFWNQNTAKIRNVTSKAALVINVATLTVPTGQTIAVGDTIVVALDPADVVFDGTWVVTAQTTTSVSYAIVSPIVPATPTAGIVYRDLRVASVGTGGFVDIFAVNGGNSFPFVKVRASDGRIYGANLIYGSGTAQINDAFYIYKWDNETAEPRLIYRNTNLGVQDSACPIGPKMPYGNYSTRRGIILKQLTGNVATLTTACNHSFAIGNFIFVSIADAVFDGIKQITGVSANTITYDKVNADVPATALSATGATVILCAATKDVRANTYTLTFPIAHGYRTGMGVTPTFPVVSVATKALTSNVATITVGTYTASIYPVTNKALTGNVATLTAINTAVVGNSIVVALVPADAVFDGTYVVTFANGTTISYAKVNVDVLPVVSGGIITDNTGVLVPAIGHEYVVGEKVTIASVDATFNGAQIITAVTANTISYAKVAANVTLTAVWPLGTAVDSLNAVICWVNKTTATTISFPSVQATEFAAAPTSAYTQSETTYHMRIGDTLDVVSGANVQIYTGVTYQSANGPASAVLRFNHTDGTDAISSVDEIVLQNGYTYGAGLSTGSVFVDGYNGQIYISSTGETARYNNDGAGRHVLLPLEQATMSKRLNNLNVANAGVLEGATSGRPLTVGPKQYFVYIERMCAGHPDASAGYNTAAVADITAGLEKAKYVDYTYVVPNILRGNTNGTGDIAFDNQTSRPGNFFALPTNQYIGSFTVPAPVAPAEKKWNAVSGSWFTGSNWTPAGVPTCNSDVVLDHANNAAAYTVQIGGEKPAVCRTLTINGQSGAKVALKIWSAGYAAGTPYQITGAGKSDITVTGTYSPPTTKNESVKPRFGVAVLKGTVPISNRALAANVVTITTSINHNYAVADSIIISGVGVPFDGTWTTVTGTATNLIKYNFVNANIAVADCGGSAAIGTDTFGWSNTGSTTTFTVGGAGVFETNGATGVAMTGAAQLLSEGFSITWGSTSGHTPGDAWIFNPLATGNALTVSGNGTSADDILVQNNGHIEQYVTARYAYIPGVIDNWGGGNTSRFAANGYYVHGSNYNNSASFNWVWPSNRASEYAVYDGATTWEPDSYCVTDLFGYPVYYPSMSRSYDFGKIVCRNSYSAITGHEKAAYTNLVNYTNLSAYDVICEPGASVILQTNGNPAAYAVEKKSLTSSVATLTILYSTNNNIQVGDVINVALSPADAAFDGSGYVVTARADHTISYAKTNADVVEVNAFGSITDTSMWKLVIKRGLNNQNTVITNDLQLDGMAATTVGVIFDGDVTIEPSAATYTFPTAFTVPATKSLTVNDGIIITKTANIFGTITDGAIATASNLTVNTPGILDVTGKLVCSAFQITGTGTTNIKSGSEIQIKHVDGLVTGAAGQIQTTNRTYNPGATYTYKGAVAQASGNALPAAIAGLKMDNPTSLSLTNSVGVTSALDLTQGEVVPGASTLSVTADGAPAVVRTGGLVRGSLTRSIDTANTGARLFPIGTIGEYAPVTYDVITTATGSGTIVAVTEDVKLAGVPDDAKAIDRKWTLTPTFSPAAGSTLVFGYQDADVPVTAVEATLKAVRDTGGGLQAFNTQTTINIVANTATVTGVTALSPWSLINTTGAIALSTPLGNDWGYVLVGNPGPAKTLRVSNTGLGIVNVSSIGVAGDAGITFVDPGAFSLDQDEQKDITVNFTPGSVGAKLKTFTVNSDAGNPTQDFLGAGSNVLATNPVDFGFAKIDTAGGTGKAAILEIDNLGAIATTYTLSLAPTDEFSTTTASIVFVDAFSSATIGMYYLPKQVDDDSIAYHLASEAVGAPDLDGSLIGRGWKTIEGNKATVVGTAGAIIQIGAASTSYTLSNLDIPAGAFTGTVIVTIQEPTDQHGKPNAVEVKFSAPTSMGIPAILYIEYLPSDEDPPASFLAVAKWVVSAWSVVGTASVDNPLGGTKTASIANFGLSDIFATYNTKTEVRDWMLIK